jgi:hypothetical protein
MWKVEIIEGYGQDLADALLRFTLEGFEVRFVNPNGVNRWTVCGFKRTLGGIAGGGGAAGA